VNKFTGAGIGQISAGWLYQHFSPQISWMSFASMCTVFAGVYVLILYVDGKFSQIIRKFFMS